MEITIKGNPKEIADLVLAVQSRQPAQPSPITTLAETVRLVISDIDGE